MPKIDNLVLFRCVQVVRRLLLKNREIGLFCNRLGRDAHRRDRVLAAARIPRRQPRHRRARWCSSSRRQALRGIGPIENESLAALAERGFRFSIDNVTDLRIEPRELANRGFRFIKVPANLLLNRTGAATDIHPGRSAPTCSAASASI